MTFARPRLVRALAIAPVVLALALAALSSGCCTEEIGQAVGEAARDSMYAEQDRLQQRFLQAEADSLAATSRMLQAVTTELSDTAAENIRKVSEASTAAFEDSMERTTTQINENFLTTMARVTEQTNEGFSRLSASMDETRAQLTENMGRDMQRLSEDFVSNFDTTAREVGDITMRTVEDARTRLTDEEETKAMRESVQPMINEIIKDSTREFGDELERQTSAVRDPLMTVLIVLIVTMVLTMILPSTLLFLSYQKSTRAIQALRAVIDARAALIGKGGVDGADGDSAADGEMALALASAGIAPPAAPKTITFKSPMRRDVAGEPMSSDDALAELRARSQRTPPTAPPDQAPDRVPIDPQRVDPRDPSDQRNDDDDPFA